MGYVKAENVLPEELIVLIQQYADGINIYVPRKSESRVGWGEGNNTKKKLFSRDLQIFEDYQSGESVAMLAKKYFLSEKRIQSILRTMRSINE